MIKSIRFRNYKVLQETVLPLGAFNLILGPNGSGKSTSVEALMELKRLADVLLEKSKLEKGVEGARCEADLLFEFSDAFEDVKGHVVCAANEKWEKLELTKGGEVLTEKKQAILKELSEMRSYSLEASKLVRPVKAGCCEEIGFGGEGFPWMLESLRVQSPNGWKGLVEEFTRLLPEFTDLQICRDEEGQIGFAAQNESGLTIPAENLSQGTVIGLAILSFAFFPKKPTLLCLEELERGIHPRLLREIRDALYRLSYPEDYGDVSSPVQIIVTTHSPYLLDLFSEHPEEVILTTKKGATGDFQRLVDYPGLEELLASGSLGDLWYSGVIGGVPY
jgi:predicted ATPase